MNNELSTFEARILFLAPELFSILHLLGSPRPYDQDSVIAAWDTWKALDDRKASEVLGWGFVLQRLFRVVPAGLAYPKKPLWRLPPVQRKAYLTRFRRFHLRKRLPLPEFFEKIDKDHAAFSVRSIQEVPTWH